MTNTSPDAAGQPLLGEFQAEYGAQLIGVTVMRIRGMIMPRITGAQVTGFQYPMIQVGAIVENDDETMGGNATNDDLPSSRQHDDWMMWRDYILASTGPEIVNDELTDAWVDVKSSRKLEELGQGLNIWASTTFPTGTLEVSYALSIGLKLP